MSSMSGLFILLPQFDPDNAPLLIWLQGTLTNNILREIVLSFVLFNVT